MEGQQYDGDEDKASWADARKDGAPASTAQPKASAQLTTEEADIPMSAIRGGSKKKVLLVALAAVVAAGAAIGGFGYWQNTRARGATAAAFGELSQCLVGEPVGSSADIALKYRSHQVAMMGRKSEDRSEGNAPWPERCATPAKKVVDAAEDAGLESSDGKSLYAAAFELAKALDEKRGLDNDMSALLKGVWEQAEAAKLQPSSSSVAGPPSHKEVLVLDKIPDSALVSKEYAPLSAMHTLQHPSEDHWVFFDRKEGPGPFFCRVEKEKLACKNVPAAVAKLGHAISVMGSSDPGVPPLLFAGKRGDAGVYRGDTGEIVDKLDTVGAWARKDGLVVLLGVADSKMTLSIQKKAGESPSRMPLDEELKPFFKDTPEWGNGFYTTTVSHGFLYANLWIKKGDEEGEWKLHAFPLGADGRPKKPAVIGELAGRAHYTGGPQFSSCRTGDARRVVRMHMSEIDFAAFLSDGSWSSPVRGSNLADARMDCSESGATFVSDTSINVCTSAECTIHHVGAPKPPLADLAPRNGASDRTMVKDMIVAVWGAGLRGGIRARRALPKEFDQSTDAVLMDDLIADGKIGEVSTVTELKVLPAGTSALVLLQTRRGLLAMRVGADGGFTPDNVVWE